MLLHGGSEKDRIFATRATIYKSLFWLGCQSWQTRVADFLCYFWAIFSKRTLLTKSVVWKGAQQTLSIPPAAAEELQAHSAWEPLPCPEGSQRVSQNPCSEAASNSKPSQSKHGDFFADPQSRSLGNGVRKRGPQSMSVSTMRGRY